LVNARAVITKRRNWTKLTYHKLRANLFWGIVPAYCAKGALQLVAAKPVSVGFLDRQCISRGYASIMSFNDSFMTTHKKMLKAFDDAIECATKIKHLDIAVK